MAKRTEVSVEIVDDFTPVHPALDFFNDTAIVSIGSQCKVNFDDGNFDFKDREMTILSNGDHFFYSKKELATRNLFYSRGMDLPMARWEHKDIKDFCEAMKNGHKPEVTIKEIFNEIRTVIGLFMDFENDLIYDLLSCFVIYTYFYPLFQSAPIVQLWGEAETGKSKTVKLLDAMCFNPINSANISEACVFRLVEGRRATLLLDESEDLTDSERGKAISNLLLAGYSVGGETYRQEKVFGDTYKTMSFKVFGPKLIANITGIKTVALRSRTIRIITTGAKDKKKANREPDVTSNSFKDIRNKLYRYMLLHFKDVVKSKTDLSGHGLTGRAFGVWEGILTIANLVGKFAEIRDFANENYLAIQEEIAEEDSGSALLRSLYALVSEKGNSEYPIGDLMNFIISDNEIEFTSKRAFSLAMKRLGFVTKVIRHGSRTMRSYILKQEILFEKLQRTVGHAESKN